MSLRKAIWEHLITKTKYNRVCLERDVARQERDEYKDQRDTNKSIYLKRKEIWEQTLKEQEEEIIRLKKKGIKKSVSKSKTASSRVSRKAKNNK